MGRENRKPWPSTACLQSRCSAAVHKSEEKFPYHGITLHSSITKINKDNMTWCPCIGLVFLGVLLGLWKEGIFSRWRRCSCLRNALPPRRRCRVARAVGNHRKISIGEGATQSSIRCYIRAFIGNPENHKRTSRPTMKKVHNGGAWRQVCAKKILAF